MIPSATYFHSFPTTEDEPHPSSLRELKAKVAAQLHARIENEIHPRKRPPTAKMKKHSAANRTASRPGYDELKKRIQQRQARVGIIGLGYVGLPLALLFSEQKFPVTGFDIDQRKVETLARGGSYIYRITPKEIQAAKPRASRRRRILPVDRHGRRHHLRPHPAQRTSRARSELHHRTTHAIAPHLRAGQLVVLESTTYPGTTEEVMMPILEKENRSRIKAARGSGTPNADNEFFVAFSPEREDPGNTTVARRDIPKVVGGSEFAGIRARGRALRINLPPHGSGLFTRCGGDDQAAGKYLPLRQHRAGQRD